MRVCLHCRWHVCNFCENNTKHDRQVWNLRRIRRGHSVLVGNISYHAQVSAASAYSWESFTIPYSVGTDRTPTIRQFLVDLDCSQHFRQPVLSSDGAQCGWTAKHHECCQYRDIATCPACGRKGSIFLGMLSRFRHDVCRNASCPTFSLSNASSHLSRETPSREGKHLTPAPRSIDREFEFYDFFSFLKFNEFYELFFRLKKIRKKFVILQIIDV